MSSVPAFYSVNEVKKPAADRVHHNNGKCAAGRDIPQRERVQGTGSYRVCDNCKEYNRLGL